MSRTIYRFNGPIYHWACWQLDSHPSKLAAACNPAEALNIRLTRILPGEAAYISRKIGESPLQRLVNLDRIVPNLHEIDDARPDKSIGLLVSVSSEELENRFDPFIIALMQDFLHLR